MNLIDSPFMPIGVNTACVKRRQAEYAPVHVGTAHSPAHSPALFYGPGPITMEAYKMLKPASLRSWATPLTIGTFALMAGSGVMMFFDIVPGYVSFAHEWMSWLFLIAVVAHILLNYGSFTRHLAGRWGKASLVAFTAVLTISTLSFGRITAPQLKWPISEALIDANLSLLAELTHRNNAQLVRELAAQGIRARPDQSVKEVAKAHGMDEFHVLGLIFLD